MVGEDRSWPSPMVPVVKDEVDVVKRSAGETVPDVEATMEDSEDASSPLCLSVRFLLPKGDAAVDEDWEEGMMYTSK